MIRVADYILKRIADEGVKHLFYVPVDNACISWTLSEEAKL